MRLRDLFKWQVPPRVTRTPYKTGGPVVAEQPVTIGTDETVIWAGRDPQPGLYETLAKRPLPSYADLKALYGGGMDQPAAPGDRTPYHQQASTQPDHACSDRCDWPTDMRAGLVDDDQAWTVKSRLSAVLGRPYLATKLADQLDGETGAILADRLEALLHVAHDQARAEIADAVSSVVDAKMREIRADRERLRKDVTHERFHGSSRLD